MTSTLNVAETEPAPINPPHSTAFTVSGGLVGCALVILVELIAIKLSGVTDPSMGAVRTWFFGGLAGLLVGALLAARCLDRRPALAETLAPLLYALTALAAPFLLYIALVMVVISWLSGMTS